MQTGSFDAIQEGSLGLIEAVDKFDEAKGIILMTYACFWIRAYVKKAARKAKVINEPTNIFHNRVRFREFNDATYEEIAETVNEENAEMGIKTRVTPKYVRYVLSEKSKPCTFTVGHNIDLIYESQDMTNQERDFQEDQKEEIAYDLLQSLDERNRSIIILRFGLYGNDPLTFKEIGNLYNITGEGARQIVSKSLSGMRIYAAELGLSPEDFGF